MFNKGDVVKWKNPQNWAERQDVMIVDDTVGVYVEVRHVDADGFQGVSQEKMEDLKFVSKAMDIERDSEIFERYKNA